MPFRKYQFRENRRSEKHTLLRDVKEKLSIFHTLCTRTILSSG
jgi:hypothetical protein